MMYPTLSSVPKQVEYERASFFPTTRIVCLFGWWARFITVLLYFFLAKTFGLPKSLLRKDPLSYGLHEVHIVILHAFLKMNVTRQPIFHSSSSTHKKFIGLQTDRHGLLTKSLVSAALRNYFTSCLTTNISLGRLPDEESRKLMCFSERSFALLHNAGLSKSLQQH